MRESVRIVWNAIYPSDGMESITTTGNEPRFTGLELSQLRRLEPSIELMW